MRVDRKYFFVKHGLDAFEVMPNFIWRTGEKEQPRAFKGVRKGDRWIAFAYTTSDFRERPLSLITGFYECTHDARYGRLPQRALQLPGPYKNAWMIEGKPYGKQPRYHEPVGVPPIDELLKRPTYKPQTFVPMRDAEEFERVRQYTLAHEMAPADIPLLGREPRNEQEVLAVVLSCYQKLGIERILRIRSAFPDMLVKLRRKAEPVHLELETYSKSFLLHGHDEQVRNRQFKTTESAERIPVAVLCWINDAKTSEKLKSCVHQVYELKQLIRDGEEILW